jgi:hypothetical protein
MRWAGYIARIGRRGRERKSVSGEGEVRRRTRMYEAYEWEARKEEDREEEQEVEGRICVIAWCVLALSLSGEVSVEGSFENCKESAGSMKCLEIQE